MKNSIHYLFLIFLLFYTKAYSQSSLDNRIAQISSLANGNIMNRHIRKVYLDLSGNYTTKYQRDQMTGRDLYTLYFNAEGQLLKIHVYYKDLDHEENTYHEFDNNGYAIRSIYHAESPASNGYSIIRYMDLSDIEGYEVTPLIYFDLMRFEDDRDEYDVSLIERISKNGLYYPTIEDGLFIERNIGPEFAKVCIREILNVINEKYNYKLKEFQSPDVYMNIQFIEPSIGDSTYLINNDIPMYESLESKTYHKISSREKVTIIGRMNEWYRVLCGSVYDSKRKEGYIHKDYLSLVEKKVD